MEKDLKSKEAAQPLAQPALPPTVAETMEREVDMESLLPMPKMGAGKPVGKPQPAPGPRAFGASSALRAARKRFWARFRARNWGMINDELAAQEKEELEATLEKYAGKEPSMNVQLEQKPRPNPKLWIKIKFNAKKHEPFFVEANCTKFTQDQADLRLELVVNLVNMQKLVGNYGKSQSAGSHSLVRLMSISDIEIIRAGKGKRNWLLKSPERRKVCFEVQNITTEMLPTRLFRINLRCSKV